MTNGAELVDRSTFCPKEPRNGDRDKHDSREGTSKSRKNRGSRESNKNHEALGTSLVDRQTSVKSCNENSELLDGIDDPQSHKGSATYSDLKPGELLEDETVPQTPPSSSDATFSCTSADNRDSLHQCLGRE